MRAGASPIGEARAARRHGSYLRKAFAGERLCRPSDEARGGKKAWQLPSQERSQESGCVAHRISTGAVKACHLPSQRLLGAFESGCVPAHQRWRWRQEGMAATFAAPSQGVRSESGCVSHRISTGGKKAWQLPSQDLRKTFAGAFAGERLGRRRERLEEFRMVFASPSQESGCVAHRRGTGGAYLRKPLPPQENRTCGLR